MKKSSWLDLPLTEVEIEVWRYRFDPDRLLTIAQIISITRHKGAPGVLLAALRKLQTRGPELPPSKEEQELIDQALRATGASNLERAYQERKLQVRRYNQVVRHKRFHGE